MWHVSRVDTRTPPKVPLRVSVCGLQEGTYLCVYGRCGNETEIYFIKMDATD